MDEQVPLNFSENAELDPFSVNAKSSVKLKKSSRGISWEIKIVTGESDLIEGLMLSAISTHKKLEEEFKDE